MSAVIDRPTESSSLPTRSTSTSWLRRPLWNRFTPLQLVVLGLASIAPVVICGAIVLALLGVISVETMIGISLIAGENPGMVTFGAMFLASPVQWFTGRSQVRVRKYLGIVFFLLAFSNGAMFALEQGIGAMLGAPFLVAGTIALALAVPLFMTSSRWAQRTLGMRRWRHLHRLTYVIAVGLLGHVILIGDFGLGAVLITLGLIARVPAVRRWLVGLSNESSERIALVMEAIRSRGWTWRTRPTSDTRNVDARTAAGA